MCRSRRAVAAARHFSLALAVDRETTRSGRGIQVCLLPRRSFRALDHHDRSRSSGNFEHVRRPGLSGLSQKPPHRLGLPLDGSQQRAAGASGTQRFCSQSRKVLIGRPKASANWTRDTRRILANSSGLSGCASGSARAAASTSSSATRSPGASRCRHGVGFHQASLASEQCTRQFCGHRSGPR